MKRPWIRTLFNLWLPGIGQAYNLDWKKALLLPSLALVHTLVFLLYPRLPGALILGWMTLIWIVIIGLYLYLVRDAWVSGKKQLASDTASVRNKRMGSAFGYVVVLCVAYLALMTTRENLVNIYVTPTGSMEPSILVGDRFVADLRPGLVQAGDVVIVRNPEGILYVTRAIGLPGDKVSYHRGVLRVNGTEAKRVVNDENSVGSFQAFTETLGTRSYFVRYDATRADWERDEIEKHYPFKDLVVPPGEIFVLGDNRDNSKDSRFVGTYKMTDIVGKPTHLWLSTGDSIFNVRWDRIGHEIK